MKPGILQGRIARAIEHSKSGWALPVLGLALVSASSFALSGCNGSSNNGFANVRATVISGAGNIQDEVDQFRTLLGALNAPGTAGQASGRREVNWDGVGDAFSNANNLPGNFFNPPAGAPGSARGLILSTPGTGLRVSGTTNPPVATLFGDVNANYPNQFAVFSPNKTFAANGSNRVICTFEVPTQSGAPAGVRGFGVVFSDVDSSSSTFLDIFEGNRQLGRFLAPARVAGSSGLSFLGVFLPDNRATRVEITAGNAALGAGVNDINAGGNVDLVIMDDFIYAEPQVLP